MALRLRSPYRPARKQAPETDIVRDPPAGARRTKWLPLRARGVSLRLLIAVLLPISVLGIGGAALLRQRYDTAREAAAIVAGIPTLDRLANVRQRFDQESITVGAWLRARQFGFNIPNIATTLGFSDESTAQARRDTDVELATLGAATPPGFASGLVSLRRQVDAGTLAPATADRDFTRLDVVLSTAFSTRLATLQTRVAGLGDSADLQASLRSLSAANDALGAGVAELGDFGNIALPGEHPGSQQSALGGDIAELGQAGQELSTAGGAVARQWARFSGGASERSFQQLVNVAASGRLAPPPTSNISAAIPMVTTLRSGIVAGRALYALVDAAESTVHARAAELNRANTDQFRLLMIEMLLAAGLTIGVALLLARSITRPLHLLETRARAVSGGDLEALVPTGRGPKETVVVSEAFNDLTNNLRLMEAQTRALSECAFDDPVLSEPLPGRLGRALHESVKVLSGSIMERDALQHRLVHQATHDALTGLYNRAATVEFLEQALARAQRSGATLAALFIDLDDFKRANDTHGHGAGDAILRQVGERLDSGTRRGDFVARLGGDEFLVVAEGLEGTDEATRLGETLLATINAPVRVHSLEVTVGASIGVAFAYQDADDEPSQLLARADLAVHRSKEAGSGRVEIYDESLQGALIVRAAVEQDLHAALDAGGDGLFLVYQPVVDAASGVMRSAEALVRWERRGVGLSQPGDFIPAAEQSDLIIRLDCWVLGSALAQLARWSDCGQAQISIAVNISGRHLLSGQLAANVEAAIDAAGVEPGWLILEVTETVLLADLATVAGELERLRALGIRVAIDDFGTGYTSLAHLQHLTVDELKIDRSFIEQLSNDGESPLVRMVTELGHQLGVSVVAEGIETDEQRTLLTDIGCDALQGFFIARPLTLEHLENWPPERAPIERAA